MIEVGIDVTPLIGQSTGIGNFTRRLVDGIASSEDVSAVGLTFTAKSPTSVRQWMPDGLELARPVPARVVRTLYRAVDMPSARTLIYWRQLAGRLCGSVLCWRACWGSSGCFRSIRKTGHLTR